MRVSKFASFSALVLGVVAATYSAISWMPSPEGAGLYQQVVTDFLIGSVCGALIGVPLYYIGFAFYRLFNPY